MGTAVTRHSRPTNESASPVSIRRWGSAPPQRCGRSPASPSSGTTGQQARPRRLQGGTDADGPSPPHRPTDDSRAPCPEPLASPGPGDRRTSSRWLPFGTLVALTAGLKIPLAAFALLLRGLPLIGQVLAGICFAALGLTWFLGFRAPRRRAAERRMRRGAVR